MMMSTAFVESQHFFPLLLMPYGLMFIFGRLFARGEDFNPSDYNSSPMEEIGKCRIHCMKFSIQRAEENRAEIGQHYNDCWNMCESLIRDIQLFMPLCDNKKYCNKGCQHACNYWNSSHSSGKGNFPYEAPGDVKSLFNNVTWTFSEPVLTQSDSLFVRIQWTRPQPSQHVSDPHPILYSLLIREEDNAWVLLTQTTRTKSIVRQEDTYIIPEFLLEAIDETGVIARNVFYVTDRIITDVFQRLQDDSNKAYDTHMKSNLVNRLNLSYDVKYEEARGLQAVLTWQHLIEDTAHYGEDEIAFYEVVYILVDCGIYVDIQATSRCPYTDELFSSIVPVKYQDQSIETIATGNGFSYLNFNADSSFYYFLALGDFSSSSAQKFNRIFYSISSDKNNSELLVSTLALSYSGIYVGSCCQPVYTLLELLFNSRYDIRLRDPNNRQPLATLVLETPRCGHISIDYQQCYDSYNDDLAAHYLSNVTTAAIITELPSITELIREVNVELLPNQFRQHDSTLISNRADTNRDANNAGDWIAVNISWTFIPDFKNANFTVTVFSLDDERTSTYVVRKSVTSQTYLSLNLLSDTTYKLMIEVQIPHIQNDWSETGYSKDDPLDVGYLYTAHHVFNTSTILAGHHMQFKRQDSVESHTVNGVVIGAVCVVTITGAVGLFVFLYVKCLKFRELIDTQAVVVNSNSYKSSVGDKVDYSNQLMMFHDEWEIDPTLLTFSSQLGQGAFGKVLTGFYANHRVAIKLVKEGAPLSYKGDLAAEIDLMKRLGSHPNIVCLIGACTLNDPIALVMEYVPLGNLQHFLKTCRLEGSLNKESDGPACIGYSMIHECGGIDNGVISPTDILSFARQVAMAMEYLADKRYVHRDLAARNVLLHYDKVVKVCDFGLSRDIFNDNHYKKITSGKLPIKWMAIESLRDRIFTTQSDVWSFGILLWEIVTMGASPYPSVALADLYYVLSNNYRMNKPSNCSQELYDLMLSCWLERPQDRPTFTELRKQVEQLMAEDRDYLLLENMDVPLATSECSSNSTIPDVFSGQMHPSSSARHVIMSQSATASMLPETTATSGRPIDKVVVGDCCCYEMGVESDKTSCIEQPTTSRKQVFIVDGGIDRQSTDRLMRPSESDSNP